MEKELQRCYFSLFQGRKEKNDCIFWSHRRHHRLQQKFSDVVLGIRCFGFSGSSFGRYVITELYVWQTLLNSIIIIDYLLVFFVSTKKLVVTINHTIEWFVVTYPRVLSKLRYLFHSSIYEQFNIFKLSSLFRISSVFKYVFTRKKNLKFLYVSCYYIIQNNFKIIFESVFFCKFILLVWTKQFSDFFFSFVNRFLFYLIPTEYLQLNSILNNIFLFIYFYPETIYKTRKR